MLPSVDERLTPPAVLYAAKSTADEHGSIPTQLADGRAAAEAEGRTIVGEYSDEAASAFKGNRGSGLTAAKDAAITAGAELWVQHSDRLARGDGITADHLAEVWFALRRHGVRLRSVQDDGNLEDAIRVVLIGERNHEDSKRKSHATRSGLQRRKDRGEPVGALLFGYRVEAVIEDGRVRTSRVVDLVQAAIVERIFDKVEAGYTFGGVARALNADGLRTQRGRDWTTRRIRDMVLNEDYTGANGYPPIVDAGRWQRIVDRVQRMDPVAVQARMGGRRPAQEYLLRRVAFCGRCGRALRVRTTTRRTYVCAAVRESRGLCDAPPIPADLAEGQVVEHLDKFIGNLEAWLAERSSESRHARDDFAETLDRQRGELRKLTLRAARAHETYERLLDAGDELAHEALRAAARMDADATAAAEAMDEAEARLEDWPVEPDVDAALDFYGELRAAIVGRVTAASTIAEANAALRAGLEGVWLTMSDGLLTARFVARVRDEVLAGRLPAEVFVSFDEDLSPEVGSIVHEIDHDGDVRSGLSERQTTVYRPEVPGVELPTLVLVYDLDSLGVRAPGLRRAP